VTVTEEPRDPDAVAHCPRCRAEYRAGFDRCADCDLKLLPGPAPAPPPSTLSKPVDHPDVVPLCRLYFPDARLLVGALQAAGIRAGTTEYENRNLPLGVTLSSTFEVLVETDQLEEARRVAADILTRAGRA
jgi:hypothetical protein